MRYGFRLSDSSALPAGVIMKKQAMNKNVE
jgi:hypothetical protein